MPKSISWSAIVQVFMVCIIKYTLLYDRGLLSELIRTSLLLSIE